MKRIWIILLLAVVPGMARAQQCSFPFQPISVNGQAGQQVCATAPVNGVNGPACNYPGNLQWVNGQQMCISQQQNVSCDVSDPSKYIQYANSGSDVSSQLSSDSCISASIVADKCCGNPASCLGPSPSGSPDAADSSTGGEIVGLILATATAIPGSMSQICGRAQDAATLSTMLTTYMTAKCQLKVQECKRACTSVLQKMAMDYATANGGGCTGSYSKVAQGVRALHEAYVAASDNCASANNADFAMAQQAVQAGLGAKFMTMCQNQANAQPAINSFNTPNCLLPGQASTPFCQYECDRPGAGANPTCAGLISALQAQQSGYNFANGAGPAGGALGVASKSMFGDIPTMPDPMQTPPFAMGTPTSSGLATTPGGGPGSGLPGSAMPMAGMGQAGGGQQGKGGGYDTGILRGVASPGGFSGGQMASGANGGFSGYGGGAPKDNVLGKKFSLKDFLPGGKKGEQRTAFRGLASTLADVSPAHDDIFKKVTDRFYQVCLRDALFDCDTLRKLKPKN